MNNKLDIFIIIILVISVSFIFGMNIISLIDRKIKNVSINIPPINIPKPHVTVNVNNGCNTPIDKQVTFENDYDIQINNKEESNNNVVEHFMSVGSDKSDDDTINNEDDNKDDNECVNKSITDKHQYENPTESSDMIEQDDMASFNPSVIYKHYKAPIIYENKYDIKGSNYNMFTNNISPQDLGVKLLPSDNEKLYPKYSKIDNIPYSYNYDF